MTITKIEVKTFYNITIKAIDIRNIVYASKTDKVYGDVFEDIDGLDEHKIYGLLSFGGLTSRQVEYIAKYFGYDGWYNIGYGNGKEYKFVAYNNGDTLN